MKKLTLTLAIVLSMTLTSMAQLQGGGLFERGAILDETYNDYNYRDGSLILPSGHGSNDDADAPLGSGLLVLTALGAGYAIKRRRNSPNK